MKLLVKGSCLDWICSERNLALNLTQGINAVGLLLETLSDFGSVLVSSDLNDLLSGTLL